MADFYNSADIEKKLVLGWRKKGLFSKAYKKNSGGQSFYFLDGPPFVTNEVHEGTMLGIFIKDAVVRYKILSGFKVRAQPGWDTHGLPIEVIVEKKLGIKNKKEIKEFGEEKFVDECKKLVEGYISLNTKLILEYGVIWYENEPYKTYNNGYIESVWYALKKAHESGLMYRGFKSTWFCVRCATPMSNYEVRDKYYPKEDTSVYVAFELEDGRYLVAWTTTPWTLPSNEALAVAPNLVYEELEIGGKRCIIAKDRVEAVRKLGVDAVELKDIPGESLVGLRYKHPFSDMPQIIENKDNIGRVIDGSSFISEDGKPFVEASEGSGIVHVAPGHGESDYKIGQANGLPVLSPIDENGIFSASAGWLQGEHVLKVNDKIIDHLKSSGLLIATEKITHDYPHCWRCKTPLISRASDQWFLSINKIKEKLIEEAAHINWIPQVSKDVFSNWIANAQDWVISRQRYWNTPMPVWVCSKCRHEIIVSSAEEIEKMGVKKPNDLHKGTLDKIKLKCDKCGGEMSRVPDVMDVWMDSGSASFACLGYPKNDKEYSEWFPADFITEGNDQIRGWFYSLLVMGYIATGRLPFKNAAMHKFILGENGNKLSKSEGNYKPLNELLKEGYSRDALRIALLKHSISDVAVFSLNDLKDEARNVNLIYNIAKLVQSIPKPPSKSKMKVNLADEDLWILSRWNSAKRAIKDALDGFRTDYAVNLLMDFISNDFSRGYIKLAKGRIFDEYDYSAGDVLKSVFLEAVPVISIFAPFIADYSLHLVNKKGSAALMEFPSIREEMISSSAEEKMKTTMDLLQEILAAREKMKIPVKRPLTWVYLPGFDKDKIFEDVLMRLSNSLHIKYYLDPNDFDSSLDFVKLKSKYNPQELTQITAKFLELTNETVMRNLSPGIKLSTDGKTYTLLPQEIIIKPKKQDIAPFDGQTHKIAIDYSLTDEVKILWIKREVIRAIQSIRKEFDFSREKKIKVEMMVNGRGDDPLKKAIMPDILKRVNGTEGKGQKLLKIQDLNILNDNVVVSVYY
jgi:isoleucyl-tRNA synthetase